MNTEIGTDNQEDLRIKDITLLQKRLEHKKTQLDTFSIRWWGFLVAALMGLAATFFEDQFGFYESRPTSEYISIFVIVTAFSALGYLFFIFYMRSFIQSSIRRIEYDLAFAGADELQTNIEENFFTKLVQINFKYIDKYYFQTQEQASKSFRFSAWAGVAGLAVVVVGVGLMYFEKTTPGYVAATAGIISEFIAAIFFYLYNRTILKMGEYHQKLVITQNIGLALKISETLPEKDRISSQTKIIEQLTDNVNSYLSPLHQKNG